MNPEPYTIGIAMIVTMAAVLLYDIYLENDAVDKNTYSEVLRAWYRTRAWLYYLTSFLMGVLMAHWGLK